MEKRTNVSVALLGASLDVANLGVRALGVSAIGLLRGACEGNLVLMYGNKTGGVKRLSLAGSEMSIPVVNYRLSPRARWNEHLLTICAGALIYRLIPDLRFRRFICNRVPWIKATESSDFVADIRGGDSFSDIYGFTRFFVGSLPGVVAALLKKKLIQLPQTFGPFSSWFARRMAAWLLRRSEKILTRDMESHELVRELIGAEDSLKYCPDVAFCLPRGERGRFDLQRRPEKVLVGLNVSGLLYMGGYTRDNMFKLSSDYPTILRNLLRILLADERVEVVFVPHVFDSAESDVPACEELWRWSIERFEERAKMIRHLAGPCEAKTVIGECDFFIGSRMHACIAAISQGIPAVGLAYSRKFRGVFESAGIGEMAIDMRSLTSDGIVSLSLQCFRDRKQFAAILETTIPALQQQVEGTFSELFGASDPEPATEVRLATQANT